MKLFAVITEWWEGDGHFVRDSGTHTTAVYADTPGEASAKATKYTGDYGVSSVLEIDSSLSGEEFLNKFGIKVIR